VTSQIFSYLPLQLQHESLNNTVPKRDDIHERSLLEPSVHRAPRLAQPVPGPLGSRIAGPRSLQWYGRGDDDEHGIDG
jgi:hypothetical protein